MIEFTALDLAPCRIVPFAPHHLTQRYVGWLNDPAVVRFSEQRHRQHDLASCRSYAATFCGSADLFLAIEAADAPDGLTAGSATGHVGNITVAYDGPNASADLSIMIGEAAARGTGIGSAAWCGMVDWLLGPAGLRRVTAGTMAANHAMIALMHKSGMTIDATRPRAFLLEGAEIDLVLATRFAVPGQPDSLGARE